MTAAQAAAFRLLASIPKERIHTHERPPNRYIGDHYTPEERAVVSAQVQYCKALGCSIMDAARRLNMNHRTVRRWWK